MIAFFNNIIFISIYWIIIYIQHTMADTAAATPVPAAETPKAKGKKAATAAKAKKPKAVPTHPPTAQMVTKAIGDLKEKGGSSLSAIKKFISSTYKVDAQKLAPFIRKYLVSAVASGKLVQTKGKGAAGSFKLATKEKAPSKEKKVAPKKKAPAAAAKAKKPAAAAAKKPKAAKKPATAAVVKKAKTPTKAKATKPKKAAKSPAKKAPKPKKIATPKKAAPKKK